MASRHMSLAVLVQGTGPHPHSWAQAGTARDPSTDITFYQDLARTAERACFDLFFVADTPAARCEDLEAWSRWPMYMNVLEPLTLLAAVAGVTSHIGLGATASTSFFEPYNLARQFASLDHISNGRAAWNVVTSANDYAARNFGLDHLPPHADRYVRAREFVEVVSALWDTYDDDAFVRDTASGRYFLPERLHVLKHKGAHFRVNGALNIARPIQGRPVIIQAGASDTGRDFAAQYAEVVFLSEPERGRAKAAYDDLKGRMAKYGRTPDQLRILAGMTVVLGATRAEAEARHRAMQDAIHPAVGLMRVAQDLEADLTGLDFDKPIPPERVPATSNHHKAYADLIRGMIAEGLTLREICQRYERGNVTLCCTAHETADLMQDWLEAGACDGFMLIFNTMPEGLDDFAADVVPELQRRGLFRTRYPGTTLRDTLGLARPDSRYAPMPLKAAGE
ncbi:LLM class flavin-dependent oxidoreductase [Zavarzinia sp. CC-PAN008]|uniref:LLM class flavin-dependent oxidoreductase n=1 Tax=Zavarzinia sp. CC-PAN008 TaxID=3243332 RepID=UPI003F745602